jgi:outer membrane protein TolC
VAAQSAQIGVALADLYPSITITGEVFVAAEEFSDLFRSLGTGGSIGPSFRWNVLNYGRISNNVRVQEARLLELIASYQNTVLTANEEVENSLVSFLRAQEQFRALAASAQQTQLALDLQVLNFKEGESDFTGVFVLQGALLRSQDELASAQGKIAASLIDVYKALGGGWEVRLSDRYRYEIMEFAAEEVPASDLSLEATGLNLMADSEDWQAHQEAVQGEY